MEVRRLRAGGLILVLWASLGASSQTRNFIVHTADPQHAVAFAQQAERLRRELAIAWLGRELPDWSYPCPITATVGPHLGAGGATSFVFDRGEVYGWRMTIQGSYQRIMDSVLPHEITHMIFATHFRRPLPRWADEGGATTMEHESEKAKHRHMLVQFLQSHRGIPFSHMFAMTEYPADIMPLYAQGYALAEYLIQQGGRPKYLAFLADGMNSGRWAEALQKHYGIQNLSTLQNQWVAWVGQGFPALKPPSEKMLAAAQTGAASRASEPNVSPSLVQPAGWSQHSSQPAVSLPSQRSVPESSASVGAGSIQSLAAQSSLTAASSALASNSSLSPASSLSSGSTNFPTPYRPGSTGQPGIVWNRPLAPLRESTSAPTPGRVGPDGWFTAGTRPAYAPSSVGRALAKTPEGSGPAGAVPTQLTRPQMPESTPRVLLQWPNSTLR